MWARTFQDRLGSWYQLRDKSQTQSLTQCLEAINAWWFRWPWCAYRLHWDDQDSWPDPWQLLEEPRLCPLARGLGIMYTLALLDSHDLTDTRMVEQDSDNLVLVSNEKYILNCDSEPVVNIAPRAAQIRHQISLVQIQKRII